MNNKNNVKVKFNSSNTIEYEFDKDNIVYINIKKYNHQNIKTFFVLLKELLDEFEEKGIKIVRHNVIENDWKTILKDNTSWSVHKRIYYIDTWIYVLECKITDVVSNVMIGFGIKK